MLAACPWLTCQYGIIHRVNARHWIQRTELGFVTVTYRNCVPLVPIVQNDTLNLSLDYPDNILPPLTDWTTSLHSSGSSYGFCTQSRFFLSLCTLLLGAIQPCCLSPVAPSQAPSQALFMVCVLQLLLLNC